MSWDSSQCRGERKRDTIILRTDSKDRFSCAFSDPGITERIDALESQGSLITPLELAIHLVKATSLWRALLEDLSTPPVAAVFLQHCHFLGSKIIYFGIAEGLGSGDTD